MKAGAYRRPRGEGRRPGDTMIRASVRTMTTMAQVRRHLPMYAFLSNDQLICYALAGMIRLNGGKEMQDGVYTEALDSSCRVGRRRRTVPLATGTVDL